MLADLPPELLAAVLRSMRLSDIGHLAYASRPLLGADGKDPLPRLPACEECWAPFSHLQADGDRHCLFVDSERRLLSCGFDSQHRAVLGRAHAVATRTLLGPFSDPSRNNNRVGHAHDLASGGPPSLRLPVPSPVPAAAALRVRGVAAGAVHSLLVTEGGAVYSWGSSKFGALGHGVDCDGRKALAGVRVVMVAASPSHGGWGLDYSHSLAVADDGAVFSWGAGKDDSRLGHGSSNDVHTPRRIDALKKQRIASVAAGENHSVGAFSTWAGGWGSGAHPLEHRKQDDVKLLPPTLVGGQLRGERVRSIAAAELHNLAVTEEGAVFSWGDATFGKLGHGNLVDWPAPRRVEALRGTQVGAVATGPRHSLAVAADGRVFGWGFGDDTLGLRAFHKAAPVYGACQLGAGGGSGGGWRPPRPVPAVGSSFCLLTPTEYPRFIRLATE
ncbi:hypothetical protein EMIHUDRAFT_453905 [Emiliania huxleyi CCMP1516]|uniref:RCC1-like domain-containing protein n=2 Tax=Emiliania huxleyi TaxID=2903 RepID=A0A0D3HZI0_EMIH1|nr:hypothetical protein EMIHUDRAFT_453905 [Emiliania huxleyi CCMP1516]EOD04415.1 hypothetical protein EMIHUDRAFT_453905 [Emiliania huxleyi CCMP1516]|eukprot:XP_005756844.1 hypothetical protein EMIHUDRAFT_453905 [Emiliania huxleyi CCMP1516]